MTLVCLSISDSILASWASTSGVFLASPKSLTFSLSEVTAPLATSILLA
jgi:hypothetical protein